MIQLRYMTRLDQATMKIDWSTETHFFSYETLEDQFRLDLNDDGSVFEVNANSSTAIATDTAGAKLRQTTDGSLFIKDGESSAFAVTYSDGLPVDLDVEATLSDGLSTSSKAIAVQKSGDYMLVKKRQTSLLMELRRRALSRCV